MLTNICEKLGEAWREQAIVFCGGWGAGEVFVVRTNTQNFASRADEFQGLLFGDSAPMRKWLVLREGQNRRAAIEFIRSSSKGFVCPFSIPPVPLVKYGPTSQWRMMSSLFQSCARPVPAHPAAPAILPR